MTPPPEPGARTRRRRTGALARPLLALLCAAICAGLAVLLARTSVGTASGQRLDQLILSGAQDHQGRLSHYAELAVGTVSVPVMAGLLALALVLVLIRRRLTLLVPLALLVVGANITTQVVKHLVVTREALGPGIEVTPNSFPSGHTTLAATAMIAVVLASGRLRALLAPLGVIWTAAAGVGTLVLGWHRPSDVVGAIVIVAGWTVLVLAIDGLHTRHRLARDAGRAPGAGAGAATRPGSRGPPRVHHPAGPAHRGRRPRRRRAAGPGRAGGGGTRRVRAGDPGPAPGSSGRRAADVILRRHGLSDRGWHGVLDGAGAAFCARRHHTGAAPANRVP